jgi:hypothetical protein
VVPGAAGAREALLATDGHRCFAPRFGGRTWIGIRLDDSPDWVQIAEHVHEAYLLTAPRQLAEQLGPPSA